MHSPVPSPLEIQREDHAHFVMLRVTGECDLTNVQQFAEALWSAIQAKTLNLVLDVTGLRYIDSNGVSVLLKIWQTMRERAGCVILVNCTPPVQRVLEIVGVPRILPVVCSLDEALLQLRADAAAEAD